MAEKQNDKSEPKMDEPVGNSAPEVAQESEKADSVESLIDVLATSEYKELQDKYLRLAAEFENYKKRNAREFSRIIETAASDLVLEMLEIVDDFRRAMLQESEDAVKLREGTQLIYNKLLDILQKRGLREIESVGKQFDPTFHEAIMQRPVEGAAEGQIIEEVLKGYFYNNKVLRPARVVVAAVKGDGDRPVNDDAAE